MRPVLSAAGLIALMLAVQPGAAQNAGALGAPLPGTPAPAAPAAAPAPTAPDAATLGDLRAQLNTLRSQLQSLRAEIVASGPQGFQAAGGDSAIDRMNAMEAQMSRLTGQTELLQNRIARIVADGSRRVGDIEFRLCEMDPSCDLAALTMVDIGGVATGGANVAPAPAAPEPTEPGAASGTTDEEQAAFDEAQRVMGQGDFLRAAQLFGTLAQTHAGGPLTAEALYLRGAALDRAGQPQQAAAAWLEGFAADPDGPRAGESLLGIARVVADGGDPIASCLYLAEIPARFPGSPSALDADRRMEELSCGSGAIAQAGGDSGAELLGLDPEQLSDLEEYTLP